MSILILLFAAGVPVLRSQSALHGSVPVLSGVDPAGSLQAGDLVVGFPNPNEVREISDGMVVDGNIVCVNNGRLRFLGGVVTLRGNLTAVNNAAVEFHGTEVRVQSDYRYQRNFVVGGTGVLWFDNSSMQLGGLNIGCAATDTAVLRIDDSSISGGVMTTTLDAASRLEAQGSQNLGEALFFGGSTGVLTNCTNMLTWLSAPGGCSIDARLPGDQIPGSYVFPDSASAAGLQYRIEYRGCFGMLWGLLSDPGSRVLLRDSDLLAVGAMYRGDSAAQVSGLVNDMQTPSYQFPSSDRDVRFERCRVRTWNIYGMESARVELTNSVFGEVLALGSSRVTVTNSICDGTGGYAGCAGTATLELLQCQVLTDVLAREQGHLFLTLSSVPSSPLRAADNSTLAALHSSIPTLPLVSPGAVALVAAIDEPLQATTNAVVPVLGTVRFLPGADVAVSLTSYWLDAYPLSDPGALSHVTGPSIRQPYRDTLGTWKTSGLQPGDYALSILLRLSTEDTLEIPRQVRLTEGTMETVQPAASAWRLGRPYPNPVREGGTVHLQTTLPAAGAHGRAEVTVTDVLGRTLLREWRDVSGGTFELNLSRLRTGAHFITVRTGGRTSTRRIMIIP